MDDLLKKLTEKYSQLCGIINSLDKALEILDLDSSQRKTALSIKEEASKEREICRNKLAPLQREAKAQKKLEKAKT
ncbi:hypothetical protein N8862_00500, partial [Pseudomonadales bacterium]|nr:hypothetical protein [Pseudomonadales bacterium]